MRRRHIQTTIFIAFSGCIITLSYIWAFYHPEVPRPCFSLQKRLVFLIRMKTPGSYQKERLPERVALTVTGSQWLYNFYDRVVLPLKVQKKATQTATFERIKVWESWINDKITRDRQNAEASLQISLPLQTKLEQLRPMPHDLEKIVGPAPMFAEVVRPAKHSVYFRSNANSIKECIILTDYPKLGHRFRYLRFSYGVMEVGTPLQSWSATSLSNLLRQSGLTSSQSRIFLAVSRLEGGFDAANTYDTGYVSVGFMQFTTGPGGDGALVDVLREEQQEHPEEFRKDFADFGVDVGSDETLHVIDPSLGREKQGNEAVLCIIRNPSLLAVFVRAGKHSHAFQSAQVRIAMRHFFPADDILSLRLKNGTTLTGHVRDVVRSEAGLATLLEGKINTGKLSSTFQTAIQDVVDKHEISTWEDIARHEREIIANSTNRVCFLNRSDLSQP